MELSDPERKAITLYTGAGYVEINGDLRGDGSGDPEVFAAIYHLDALIARSIVVEALTLYRGVDEAYAGQLQRHGIRAGESIVDKAFLSTSAKAECARPFRRSGGGMLFRIRVPAGGKALYLAPYSANPNEEEYLLPREVKLIILGYDAVEDVLELEVADDG